MKRKLLVSLIGCGIFIATNAQAITAVGPAKITYLENGWQGEGIAIRLETGLAGCSGGAENFAVLAQHPAYKDIVALATTAFVSSTNVELIVEEGVCVFGGRTKVLSIRLYK